MYIISQFTDFAGQVHHFVVVGIIKNNVVSECSRSIFTGISICNPEDKFDVYKGIKIAQTRAEEKEEPIMTSNIPSCINDTILKSVLTTLVEKVKCNPEKFIKGYEGAKQKFIYKMDLINEINNFSDEKKRALKSLIENLDSVIQCLDVVYQIKSYLNEEEIDFLFNDKKVKYNLEKFIKSSEEYIDSLFDRDYFND